MNVFIACLCTGLIFLLMGCETGLGRIYGGGTIGNSGVRGAGIGINIDLGNQQKHRNLFFTEHERELIRNYYRKIMQTRKSSSGSGGGTERVIQGSRKRTIRIAEVLPGVRVIALPDDLERQLHDLPQDYIRGIVDSDIVLINKTNRVVMDVLVSVVM